MAKKTVASYQGEKAAAKKYTKLIRFVKNKNGNYTTAEKIIKYEDVDKELGKGE